MCEGPSESDSAKREAFRNVLRCPLMCYPVEFRPLLAKSFIILERKALSHIYKKPSGPLKKILI